MFLTHGDLFRIGALGSMTFSMQGGRTEAAEAAFPPPTLHGWLNTRQTIYGYDQYAKNDRETAFSTYNSVRIAAELHSVGVD